MADIFLSYAHEDLERARSLADALTSEGWAVFWDRRIPPGRTFEDYIEQHVRECRVLVVLWSPHASASRWVKIEAAIGRDRDILIPVLIVPATIPFGYAHLHAADLTAWSPGTSTLEYQELLSSIESLAPRTLPRSLVESKQPSTPASSAPSSAVSGSDEAPAASATPTAPPASLAPHSAVASQGPESTRPAAERLFSGPTTQSQPVTKEELGASAPGGWLKDLPFSSESNVGFEQGGPGKASPWLGQRSAIAMAVVVAIAAYYVINLTREPGEPGRSIDPSASASAAHSAVTGRRVDRATVGGIKGIVAIIGNAPENLLIRMNADPVCIREANRPQFQETYRVSGDRKALGNVFVYIKDGLDNYVFDTPSTPVTLNQKACLFSPRVFGVRVGQPLEIVNGDPTLHNIHALPKSNAEFNTGQPIQGMKTTHSFNAKEVMVPVKCDVHGWMSAYVGVMDHPYYAVTDGEGKFELKDVPPGTYTVEAWHEKLGAITQTVTLSAKESKEIRFALNVQSN